MAPMFRDLAEDETKKLNAAYEEGLMSIRMMRQLVGGRMYPLTLEGLDRAMRELVR